MKKWNENLEAIYFVCAFNLKSIVLHTSDIYTNILYAHIPGSILQNENWQVLKNRTYTRKKKKKFLSLFLFHFIVSSSFSLFHEFVMRRKGKIEMKIGIACFILNNFSNISFLHLIFLHVLFTRNEDRDWFWDIVDLWLGIY